MARSVRGLAVLAVLVFCAAAVQATPLSPGGTVSGSTAGNVLPSYSGTVIAVTPFAESEFLISTPNGPTVGFVSSAVVKTSAPGLDFVYQVNVAVGAVTSLAITSFHDVITDVSQTADHTVLASTNQFFPGNVKVASYARTSGAGDTINLTFAGSGVTSEQASYLVIVHTNSPTFTESTVSINGTGSITVATLAPVPEPTTLVLWGGSFAAIVCLVAARRHKVKSCTA